MLLDVFPGVVRDIKYSRSPVGHCASYCRPLLFIIWASSCRNHRHDHLYLISLQRHHKTVRVRGLLGQDAGCFAKKANAIKAINYSPVLIPQIGKA